MQGWQKKGDGEKGLIHNGTKKNDPRGLQGPNLIHGLSHTDKNEISRIIYYDVC